MKNNGKDLADLRVKISGSPLFFYRHAKDLARYLSNADDLDEGKFFDECSMSEGVVRILTSQDNSSMRTLLCDAEAASYSPPQKLGLAPFGIESIELKEFIRPKVEFIESKGERYVGFLHGAPISFVYSAGAAWINSNENTQSIRMINLTDSFHSSLLDEAKHLDGYAISFMDSFSWKNYAHWTLDHFPRILAIMKSIKDKNIPVHLVFNDELSSFHKTMLNYCGVTDGDIISTNTKTNNILLRFDGVYSTNLQYDFRHSLNHGSSYLAGLVNDFTSNVPSVLGASSLKIVIERPSRGLYLSSDVKGVLLKLGFLFVSLEKMSYEIQVDLFRSASHVISPHGAGLSNLVYSKTGTKVLELFNNTLCTHAFYTLAIFKGLEYTCLKSEYAEDKDLGIDARCILTMNDFLKWT